MTLRLAVLGTGYGARVLAPAALRTGRWTVVGVGGRDPAAVGAAAAAHAARAYDRMPDAFDDKDVDAVALALPPSAQASLLEAYGGMKHLFVEKPLAASLSSAEGAARAAMEAGRRAVIGFGFRRVPAFAVARRLIADGDLGEVMLLAVDWTISTRSDASLPYNWKSDAAQGGGSLNMMGSHVLDYARWLGGELEHVAAVETSIVRSRQRQAESLAVTGGDTCAVAATLRNGGLVSMALTTAAPAASGHSITIHGRGAQLRILNGPRDDYYSGFRLWTRRAGALRWTPVALDPMPCDRVTIAQSLLETLADSIEQDVELSPSLADGVAVQRCLDAAWSSIVGARRSSSASGAVAPLPVTGAQIV